MPSQWRQRSDDLYPGGPGKCAKSDGAWYRNGSTLEACVIAVVNWRGALPPAGARLNFALLGPHRGFLDLTECAHVHEFRCASQHHYVRLPGRTDCRRYCIGRRLYLALCGDERVLHVRLRGVPRSSRRRRCDAGRQFGQQ